ncbi:hypothetical protein GCM10011608_08630 [Micromonospora sonchi]|uniref:DivIVA domain-containing protein n=1 Tax=Micromonospora sonchi TaxID=1763543 RepID=A0A917WSX9_9ACTN|nr:DivIVA domain-containing protein [Micromonospora sonchi]GGM26165.1 hypothetical protein GCM10011608_08630 [Micromonospora sonchi]
MGQLLLVLVVAVTVAAVVFGVTALVGGRDPGLVPTEADGRAVPLPGDRPLRESDVGEVRFDTALRGYRMAQVDQAMRRAAYDIGYKTELIGVLEAEVTALRQGQTAEADALRRAREQSAGRAAEPVTGGAEPVAGGAEPVAGDAEPVAGDAAEAAPAESADAALAVDPTPESGTEFAAVTTGGDSAATAADAGPATDRPDGAGLGDRGHGEVAPADAADAQVGAPKDEPDASAVRSKST